MKILYYSPHPQLNLNAPAGYATHMRETILAFEQTGHDVKPLIAGGTEWNKVELKKGNGLKQAIKFLIPKLIWETLKDKRLLKKDKELEKEIENKILNFQPDLIYERFNYMQSSGCRSALNHNKTFIVEINSPYIEEREILQGKTLLKRKAEKLEKFVIENSNLVVVVSSSLKAYFSDKYPEQKDKIIVVPNAISDDWLDFKLEIKSENEIVIGFVGSLFPWHGIDLLIEAFYLLQKSYTDVRLQIVGGGEIEGDLKKMVSDKQLDDKVEFTGNVPHQQIKDVIAGFDIAVMAKSNWYGSPVKIFEYGAMSKAVIAPDNGPVKDVMSNMEHGILVKPEVPSILAALETLVNDSELRKKLGEQFSQKIQKEHTWKKNVERILSKLKNH